MTTGRRPGLRTLLASTGYRRLFAARTISRWSGTVNTVALVVLVFRLTGSGLGVSGPGGTAVAAGEQHRLQPHAV